GDDVDVVVSMAVKMMVTIVLWWFGGAASGGDDRDVVAARWSWRYGDDGGDDLDGIVGAWWLRQQRAAKVVAAGGRNISPEMGRRRKFREEGGENFDG
ncbi:hypothetical protein Tco_0473575, partial [Tanacetum coccineum]